MSENGLPSLLERHWAESALAIGAVIIAAVSLWVAFDTERTNRELVVSQRQLVAANSWPYMQIGENDQSLGGGPGITLLLMNQGIGPAKLETFELFWKGKPQRGPGEFMSACCNLPPGSDAQIIVSSTHGTVVRPGGVLNFIGLTTAPDTAASVSALRAGLRDISFRYCYCSVFDECWLVNRTFGKPPELSPGQVKVCPVPAVPYGQVPYGH
jgi:hypothetical protein